MPGKVSTMRKITLSLPQELVEFADAVAATMRSSRSNVIAESLAAQRGSAKKPGWRRRGTGSTLRKPASLPLPACKRFRRCWAVAIKRGDIYWVEFDPVKGCDEFSRLVNWQIGDWALPDVRL